MSLLDRLFREDKYKRMLLDILFVAMVLMCVGALRDARADAIKGMSVDYLYNIIIAPVATLVMMLVFGSILFSHKYDATNMSFALLVFFTGAYQYLDGLAWLVDYDVSLRSLNTLANTLFYLDAYAMTLSFWAFFGYWTNLDLRSNKFTLNMVKVIAFAGMILVLGNLIGEYYFTVDDTGKYMRTEGYFISMICPILLVFICTYHILVSKVSFRNKLVFMSYPWFPYLGALITVNAKGPTFMATAVFFSSLLLYTNLYSKKEQQNVQYKMALAEKEVELARKETEIANGKAKVVMSQIKPHFLYNALTAIMMIDGNPPETKQALKNFARFLRSNINSIEDKHQIPFEKEMEHVKEYLSLEMLRFEDIKVEYDIQETDFMIPPLCLQILVENAVLHGVSVNKDGGCIRIETRATEEGVLVRVIDDGPGFDVEEAKRMAEQSEEMSKDGRQHVGLKNVYLRLQMVGDDLELHSEIGKGTIAEIRIKYKTGGT